MTYNVDELGGRFDAFIVYDFSEQERKIRALEYKVQDIVNAINELAFDVSEIMSDFDKRIASIEHKERETEGGAKNDRSV